MALSVQKKELKAEIQQAFYSILEDIEKAEEETPRLTIPKSMRHKTSIMESKPTTHRVSSEPVYSIIHSEEEGDPNINNELLDIKERLKKFWDSEY
jgi:hypothetical protein